MARIRTSLLATLIIVNLVLFSTALSYDCSRLEYERCVRMADPLIKEVHFIFPDNMNDIDVVCRTWNNFVDCLKRYTERCFNDQQRIQFNKAVENPIESIHEMCTQPNYQREYLQYAPCIKSTVVDSSHCGPHYNLLVDQVDQGDVISKATLCCSHDRFKQCVLRETRQMCDRGVPDGPAARFSSQIIDKALSFLQDQCYNYIPNSGDCTTITTDNLPYSDTLMISTAPSEIYPWSTSRDAVPKERMVPPKPTTSWLPSSNQPPEVTPNSNFESTYAGPTQNLGSRTRPASYGRASSWGDAAGAPANVGNTQPGLNTVQVYSDTPMSTIPAKPGGGATVSTWTVVNPSPVLEIEKPVNSYYENENKLPIGSTAASSSTTWYPAAGSQLSNDVEEPNQMGLVKPENAGNGARCSSLITIVAVLVVGLCSVFY